MPAARRHSLDGALEALGSHWPEYLIEAAALGTFMVSACVFTALLEYPGSPVRQVIGSDVLRRALMGVAMGLTAIGVIYSPWGKQSGAHMNPAVTLTFFHLGRVKPWDAGFYMAAQFVGGIAGVVGTSLLLERTLAHPAVNYAATLPGRWGAGSAFAAEVLITFILMSVILTVSAKERLARLTGLFAGSLVATFILVEAPVSGMSMNPARTFASAASAKAWTALWIYFTAPLIGMLLAAEVNRRVTGRDDASCAKLHHQNRSRCIFCGRPEGVV